MRWLNFTFALALLGAAPMAAQPLQHGSGFTRADTLRGSNGPFRAWWDVGHYDVRVRPDLGNKAIQGETIITITTLAAGQRMQIDLQQPLVVDSIKAELAAAMDETGWGSENLHFTRDGNVVWVDFPGLVEAGSTFPVKVFYHGKPHEARNPPWDGGWTWTRTESGEPWATVACQGLGASVWYPCKDYQGDEPDSAALHIIVPEHLKGIGNGRLRGTKKNGDGTTTWNWAVESPINAYNLVPYIGPYTFLGEVCPAENGKLTLDYWVLRGNEVKALDHFRQVPGVIHCLEEWFGPYPFPADGYKLVEAPHLGMEHQSAIAYGNRFQDGYAGTDLSGTGWGLKWDFIIVHESAHEWFGNNITTADIADMWVHEAFANYAEALYTECRFGKGAGEDYVVGLRKNIRNDIPVQGPYGVNKEGSTDMYYKGSNMLHTIRHIMADDSLFKAMLREMNHRFHQAVVTGAQVEQFISAYSGIDLSRIFDQYLRTTHVPELQWTVHRGQLYVRFANCVNGLVMPVGILVNGEQRTVPISDQWSIPAHGLRARTTTLQADRNWYITTKRVGKAALRESPAR